MSSAKVYWEWQKAILRDCGLSPQARHLAVLITTFGSDYGHMPARQRRFAPGVGRLAREMGRSDRQCRRYLKAITSAGWLLAFPRRGAPTVYCIGPFDAEARTLLPWPTATPCPRCLVPLVGCGAATPDTGVREGGTPVAAIQRDLSTDLVAGGTLREPAPGSDTAWKYVGRLHDLRLSSGRDMFSDDALVVFARRVDGLLEQHGADLVGELVRQLAKAARGLTDRSIDGFVASLLLHPIRPVLRTDYTPQERQDVVDRLDEAMSLERYVGDDDPWYRRLKRKNDSVGSVDKLLTQWARDREPDLRQRAERRDGGYEEIIF